MLCLLLVHISVTVDLSTFVSDFASQLVVELRLYLCSESGNLIVPVLHAHVNGNVELYECSYLKRIIIKRLGVLHNV